jgi:hypothetical protein
MAKERLIILALLILLSGIYALFVIFSIRIATSISNPHSSPNPIAHGDTSPEECPPVLIGKHITIKFYSSQKGFGIIRFDNNKEALLRRDRLAGTGISPHQGEEFIADIQQDNCDDASQRTVVAIRRSSP